MDANQSLPDGCAGNDHEAIGYFEVKPIKHATNHKKINIDLPANDLSERPSW